MSEKQTVTIRDDSITLGQLLKVVGAIDTGGQAKWFLSEVPVKVNDQPEDRRGRKMVPGDRIDIEGMGTFEIRRES